jgi:hypothetical protein
MAAEWGRNKKPRIDIEIEPELKQRLQIDALRRNVTVKDIITKLILQYLRRS